MRYLSHISSPAAPAAAAASPFWHPALRHLAEYHV